MIASPPIGAALAAPVNTTLLANKADTARIRSEVDIVVSFKVGCADRPAAAVYLPVQRWLALRWRRGGSSGTMTARKNRTYQRPSWSYAGLSRQGLKREIIRKCCSRACFQKTQLLP